MSFLPAAFTKPVSQEHIFFVSLSIVRLPFYIFNSVLEELGATYFILPFNLQAFIIRQDLFLETGSTDLGSSGMEVHVARCPLVFLNDGKCFMELFFIIPISGKDFLFDFLITNASQHNLFRHNSQHQHCLQHRSQLKIPGLSKCT